MMTAVLAAYGLSEADRLGSGWESSIYPVGHAQILHIPNPEPGV